MADKNWKKFERRVASFFGATRTPMSGGNSKHTRADIIHDYLFVECKDRKKQAVWGLFDNTKKLAQRENKIPVLALHEPGRKGFLVCCYMDDLDKVIDLKNLYIEEQKGKF